MKRNAKQPPPFLAFTSLDAGSPAFLVVWEALNQYVDNQDEGDASEATAENVRVARDLIESFDQAMARLATAGETGGALDQCPVRKSTGILHRCTSPAGHEGLHEAGGVRWGAPKETPDPIRADSETLRAASTHRTDGTHSYFESQGGPVAFVACDQALVTAMHEEGSTLRRALSVLVLDPRIRGFLEKNDPKALEQARAALKLGKALT